MVYDDEEMFVVTVTQGLLCGQEPVKLKVIAVGHVFGKIELHAGLNSAGVRRALR